MKDTHGVQDIIHTALCYGKPELTTLQQYNDHHYAGVIAMLAATFPSGWIQNSDSLCDSDRLCFFLP